MNILIFDFPLGSDGVVIKSQEHHLIVDYLLLAHVVTLNFVARIFHFGERENDLCLFAIIFILKS